MDGYDVLRKLRLARIDTPTLILTGLDGTESKLKGFGAGADDYLTKPFDREELIARIHAIVRRSKGHAQSIINTGIIAVNLDAKTVESRRQDGRGGRASGASDRQGIPDAGAALAAKGINPDQGVLHIVISPSAS
jgi:DNA-binding response OmpR family regulator